MIKNLGIRDIDAELVSKILQLEENHYLDLKAKEITVEKLNIHATAFANSAGGEIYVGIDENDQKTLRTWRGFDSVEDANSYVQVLNKIFQGSDLLSIEFLRGAGVPGFVIHLIIEKSKEIISTTKDLVYVRVSAQKLPFKLESHDEINQLKMDKGLISYEDTPINDIDIKLVSDSLTITEFMLEAVPVSDPESWLRSQFLITDNRPTVACLLLFADQPQAVFPKRSAIKILRYKTSEREGHRDQMDGSPITIEGAANTLIKSAVEKTVEIVESQSVQRVTGLNKVKYPTETLHEIITNAVLHRDYSIATDVQVRIFDNRIEVESPGRLPGHVTVENILETQFARNAKLVRLINKFPDPPNKDVGEGINTAFQKMTDLGLKPPRIFERERSLEVEIRHERLASFEEQIIEHLKIHNSINNSTAREITGEGSENKIKRVFERMIEAGQIYRDPEKKGKATRYLLAESKDRSA